MWTVIVSKKREQKYREQIQLQLETEHSAAVAPAAAESPATVSTESAAAKVPRKTVDDFLREMGAPTATQYYYNAIQQLRQRIERAAELQEVLEMTSYNPHVVAAFNARNAAQPDQSATP